MTEMLITLFGVLFVMLAIGVPISISLGISALVAFMIFEPNTALVVIPQRMFTTADNYVFLAVPFFMLSGELMLNGGISEKLINFVKVVLYRVPANLACVTTAASAFFGAISGSNPATVAAIGGIMVPGMIKDGYPKEKAAAIAASAGTLGVIIPPSIPMVTYSITASASLGAMFIAGIFPGIILALVIMGVSIATCRKYDTGVREKVTFRMMGKATVDALWGLMMPVIILGGIYSGIFTPTEAAAVSCVYAFIISKFVYKKLENKDIRPILVRSAINSGICMLVLALSAPFSWLMTSSGLPGMIAEGMVTLFNSRIMILLSINVMLLFLGCFLETQSIILLVTPILLPVAVQLGIHPIMLGVIIIVNTSVGMITPPMAVNLFVASRVSGCTIEGISKKIIPFLIAETVALLIMSYFPEVVLWFPRLLGAI